MLTGSGSHDLQACAGGHWGESGPARDIRASKAFGRVTRRPCGCHSPKRDVVPLPDERPATGRSAMPHSGSWMDFPSSDLQGPSNRPHSDPFPRGRCSRYCIKRSTSSSCHRLPYRGPAREYLESYLSPRRDRAAVTAFFHQALRHRGKPRILRSMPSHTKPFRVPTDGDEERIQLSR